MTITVTKENEKTILAVEGRVNTATAPELNAKLGEVIDGTTELVFDFAGLEYISSAGLRVLLVAQKEMNGKAGSMVVRNINESIMEVLEVTGFSDFLTVE